jgi:prolipoprotein diacylglyceryltransferase
MYQDLYCNFLKENQTSFEDKMFLNMEQWLSIPLIFTGIYFLIDLKFHLK